MVQRFPALSGEQWVQWGQTVRSMVKAGQPVTDAGLTRVAIEIVTHAELLAAGQRPKTRRELVSEAFGIPNPDDDVA